MPDRTQQINGVPTPSPSNDEPFSENQNRRNISQGRQTPRSTQIGESNGQTNRYHTTTTNEIEEEEEQWHPIPITFRPPPTPRIPSISHFSNLSRVITQIGPQIIIEEELPIPREDSPTLGTQEPFRTLIESTSVETETEILPVIPPRSLRRPRRRSQSSESEPSTSEVTGGRRENRVEYIGAQGLDRVNGVNGVNAIPRPTRRMASRSRRRDAPIGVGDEDANRFPMPPFGRVSRLRGRNVSGIDDDDALMRRHMATRMAVEAGVEGEGEGPNGKSFKLCFEYTSPLYCFGMSGKLGILCEEV